MRSHLFFNIIEPISLPSLKYNVSILRLRIILHSYCNLSSSRKERLLYNLSQKKDNSYHYSILVRKFSY